MGVVDSFGPSVVQYYYSYQKKKNINFNDFFLSDSILSCNERNKYLLSKYIGNDIGDHLTVT